MIKTTPVLLVTLNKTLDKYLYVLAVFAPFLLYFSKEGIIDSNYAAS